MTPYSNEPAAWGGDGSAKIVRLGGLERVEDTASPRFIQAGRLFGRERRQDALWTAHHLNEAARRCDAEARQHRDALALPLHRLAQHYASQAAEWFRLADTLPEAR